MAAASNTFEAFRECIGRTIVGVMKDALPTADRRLAAGNKTFVFDDGTGLTIAPNGSYWRESKAAIERAVRVRKRELDALTADVQDVLRVAGAVA